MFLFFQVTGFGFLAFVFFALSVRFRKRGRFVTGLTFGVLELLSAAISSSVWAWALKVSGKTDWLLLGIFRYTPIALLCYAMFAAGVWCVITNACSIKNQKNIATQA